MAETINLGIVGIKNMGEYNSQTNYEKLNVVTYQGSSYCALKETIGNLPTNTEYWQLYAEKGDTGDTGQQGPRGETGPVGPKGDPSGAPLAVSSVDAMTDTTKVYVNTTDGKWYYYDGDSWEIGGVYQATSLDESITNEIYNSALQINQLQDDYLKMNEYLFKDGYYYTYTNQEATLHQEGNTHYQISNIYPIKVTCGDTIEIIQPEEHKYKFKIGIKQENGIIIYNTSWQSNLTSYRIFATGDMYFQVQRDSMHSPSVTDFINAFKFRLKNKLTKLNNNDEDLECKDLRKEFFINKFGNLLWDNNVTNIFYPGNDLRYFTAVPFTLPYDLKVSLSDYRYNLAYSEWSSNVPSNATLIHDYGNLNSEQPIILSKNHYYIIGIRKTDNSAMDYDTAMNLLKFEKIERKEIIDNFNKSPIKSINHRGFNTVAPENTIPAFKLSKINGFNIIETDLRKTNDGVFVLLHDASINRTARNSDGTEISGTVNIADITYEQALNYDFGIWKSSEYAGTKIPTLDQLLELCRNVNLYIYLELQSGAISSSDLSTIFNKIKNYGMMDKVTMFSANAGLNRKIVAYDPYIRTCICTWDSTVDFKARYDQLKTPYNEVVALIDYNWYDTVIDSLKNLNIPCEVWTLDNESDIYLLNDYVTGVESDLLVAENVLYNHYIN